MTDANLRSFVHDGGAFEHAGIRRRMLTHDRYHSKALDRFMLNPDGFCKQYGGESLKSDRTTSISLMSFDGMAVVVKRYNTRSPLHVFKRALRVSRAEHSWRNAARLLKIGIPTPQPIAAIEERLGPIRRRAWYLSAWVDGLLLSDWFANRSEPEAADWAVMKQIENCFRLMRDNHVAHGDTKATNWIVAGGRIHLIDLDSMRQYRHDPAMIRLYRQRFQRDVARFLRNFDSAPNIRAAFASRLEPLALELHQPDKA